MKQFLQRFSVTFFLIISFAALMPAWSQTGVLNPADPIVVYNPSSPPTQPPYGQIKKWVKTNRLNWNTSSFKSYIYKGMAFRLKFPKTYKHGVADGKTYPLILFLHGVGEKGSVYDNEFQLYHGGQKHSTAVDNGSFDGFLFYPQNTSGFFGATQYGFFRELLENFFVPQIKLDINRVSVHGLSGGGGSTWSLLIQYPKLYAAGLPMSAVSTSFGDAANVNKYKYTPIWHFQGGLDNNPHPNTSKAVGDKIRAAGGNYKYTLYPNLGHGTWNTAYNEPDFFPFMMRAHKANPWALFGRTEFCQGDPINIKLGVTAGFDGYEWRKNGVSIPGNSNEITVTSLGTYDCRIRRGSVWSAWSPQPVQIKVKGVTTPPKIEIVGLMSKAIPALDGNNSVKLGVSEGYSTYAWQRTGSSSTLGTAYTYSATTAGDYTVRVMEQFGCAPATSAAFRVVNANGPNKPSPATNLVVTPNTNTSLRLTWLDNPAPAYNETEYEVYQATQSGGPYKLIAITGANASTYVASGLTSLSRYYFVVRAVNGTGASAASNEANGSTSGDTQAPSAPTNTRISSATSSVITLAWNAATDNVGVTKYDVYIDGQKSFVTTQTNYPIYNLQTGVTYNFYVRARDAADNVSGNSNEVSGKLVSSNSEVAGLRYKYYTNSGERWENLPNFSTLTPKSQGTVPNVNLDNRTQEDSFGFVFEGMISIPVSGLYTFRLNSDDGSKLYLGGLNETASPYNFSANALVDNDGLHGSRDRDGSIMLNAGKYPFAVAFFEHTEAGTITVSWNTPQTGSDFVPIPDAAFTSIVAGPAPAPLSVYVNFNRDNPAASPWNNTNNVPQLGSVYSNLLNDKSNPSGINMTVAADFSGENPFGMVTGNNSGVYPDNVIRSSWWLDAGVTGQLKLSGLNLSTNYTFVFFGSRNGGGDRTTVYTINNTSVSLNCSYNISNTVQIDNVRADQNGEVIVSVSKSQASQFGYISSMVIKANATSAASRTSSPRTNSTVGLEQQPSLQAITLDGTSPVTAEVSGFPNPFKDQVTVSANFEKPQSKVTVRVVDLSGRLLFTKDYNNIPQGGWSQRLSLAGSVKQTGIYMLQVTGSESSVRGDFKLIKVK